LEILKKEKIKINLRNIQKKYLQLFHKRLRRMTFSLILRYHLNIHYMQTKVKNPKLEKSQYLFMKHFFVKGIGRAIN
jgi:hypothetical protein